MLLEEVVLYDTELCYTSLCSALLCAWICAGPPHDYPMTTPWQPHDNPRREPQREGENRNAIVILPSDTTQILLDVSGVLVRDEIPHYSSTFGRLGISGSLICYPFLPISSCPAISSC